MTTSLCFDEKVHLQYISALKEQKKSLSSCMTEHMRMSGVYWGVTAMALIGKEHLMEPEKIVAFVLACQQDNGGFSGNVKHDAHLLYTCHAVLILAVLDALGKVDGDKIANYVAALQQPDGSFGGDEWGELDTKFTYCALSVLSILKKRHLVNIDMANQYIAQCRNFDGGFGNLPGCESHGGHVFTAVGSLSLGLGVQEVSS